MNKYEKQYEPLVIGKTLIDYIKDDSPEGSDIGDLISLYTFYYYTAKWQETNQAKSQTGYTAKCLNWSEARVRKSKRILISLKLIEEVRQRDENGNFVGNFIFVRFMWSDSKVKEVQESLKNNDSTTLTIFRHTVKSTTNALSSNKGNALKKEKYKKEKNQETFLHLFPKKFQSNESFQQSWIDFVEDRKERKIPLTTRAVKIIVNKIQKEQPSIETAIQGLETAIEKRYRGVFFTNQSNNKTKQQIAPPPKKKNDAYQKNKDNEPVSVWGQTDQDDLDALQEADNQYFRKHRRRMNKSEQERWLEKRLGF